MAATAPLRSVLAEAFPDRPFAVAFWDGTRLEPTASGGPTFTLTGPGALRHLLRAPGQLGLGRAYAAGLIEVDDLDRVLPVLDGWQPPIPDLRLRGRLAVAAARAAGPGRARVPGSELRLRGRRHSPARDAAAVRHHYDVPAEFFGLFLGETMAYSCAIFSRGATTLEAAQRDKLELVCTKLALEGGDRLLDVGCGWGSLAIHAAQEHGVKVIGITLSESQARAARERVAAAGLTERVEIRAADYRALPPQERYDAIASIGMVEHVGEERIDEYARVLAGHLAPGGRLLNHGVARLRPGLANAGPFSERYVFPDGDPLPLSRIQLALERAELRTEHAESFGADYVETLRHWAANLDARLEEALWLAGPERLRVWRLYLRAARSGFETGHTSIYQVRCVRQRDARDRERAPGSLRANARRAKTGA